jgi:hypothetical protein
MNYDLDQRLDDTVEKEISSKTITREDIMKTPFIFFQEHKKDYYNMAQEALQGIVEESLLSKVFFSEKNMDLIQKRIIRRVFEVTNGEYLIEPQCRADLLVVMRGVYLQQARNYPNKIREQVLELDNLVVDDVVPGIVSQVQQYVGYLKDIYGPREVIARPKNDSTKGLMSLPSYSSLFF